MIGADLSAAAVPPGHASLIDDVDPDVLRAVMSDNSALNAEEAAMRARGQGERVLLMEELTSRLPGQVGGYWMRPNAIHATVAVTTSTAEEVVKSLARRRGMTVDTEIVAYSGDELQARARQLYEGHDPDLGKVINRLGRLG